MHGRHYLFLSEDRGPDSRLGSTPLVESTVYVMEPDGRFTAVQKLPTDGAHAAEHFSAGGEDWLAVANFGKILALVDFIAMLYRMRSELLERQTM